MNGLAILILGEMEMLKNILAVIFGLVIGACGIMLIQSISGHLYPWPEGLEFSDEVGVKQHYANLPIGAFLMVILSYVVGSLCGGITAALVSKEQYRSACIVGGVLTLAGIANAMMVPQPLWVSFVSLGVFIPCALLGAKCIPTKFMTG